MSARRSWFGVAYSLHDYLDLDFDEAVQQWRAILARERPAAGKRQESFRPVEIVLCVALFRLIEPGRFGGSNIHLLPEPVLRLAQTLRRPPGSLTNKMLNLSFQRKHGTKFEPEVFLRLRDEQHLFCLYHTVVNAARSVGLGELAVPDFIDGDAWLLGQDELGSAEFAIARETVRDAVETAQLRVWFGEQETERFVEQKVRLGQHRFAVAVLDAFDHRCGFCGFTPHGLGGRGMLVASHIKPWAACESAGERIDPRNGIAACPTHDKAFDGGLLTVNGGLRIHRARGLESKLCDRVTGKFFGDETLSERLLVRDGAEPGLEYLEYHKKVVFEKVG